MVIITRSIYENIKKPGEFVILLASDGVRFVIFPQCLESHVHLERDGPGLSSFGSRSFCLPSIGKPFFYVRFAYWTPSFCHA